MSFQELKSEEHLLNLIFCFNYFDYIQFLVQWVSGWWVDGSVVNGSVVLIRPFFCSVDDFIIILYVVFINQNKKITW